MKKAKKIKYASAVKELDEILEFLQAETVDVEELSGKIKRAAELVEYCRRQINATEIEVKKVLDKFNSPQTGSSHEGPAAH